MADNLRCVFIRLTGASPFKRCEYCEKKMQECFGFQFFFISFFIIALLVVTFFITDIPILVLDVMIVIILLIILLSYLASKETNEIVINNAFLSQLNRELEEKVQIRTEELQESNVMLKKINQMKNEFIGIINHELKSPITSVLSGIEVIKAHGVEKLDASQNKLLNIMERSGQDMLHLTNNLLDLSKIESGKIEIHPENFPLINMMEEIAQSLKPEADKRKIKIKMEIDDRISLIYGDPERLKQAIFNLVDNAVKYTKEGGTVDIHANKVDSEIRVEVKDSGIGIKQANLNSIFDKFAKHLPGYKGTGLGLYITKSFVEAHDGNLEAESEFGKGSVFRIRLPLMHAA